ncbi:hypothetical protein NW753_000025 [Fusarium oxysporum]|nr:hypothetical protein NW763_008185 [Fusarium oxysporum]KAJ4069144.1 hypothetical protein NW753_000025 [Fusarium oxysporum]
MPHNHTNELETELLGIEPELLAKQVGYFHSNKRVAEKEHHSVRGRRKYDTDLAPEPKGMNEIVERQRAGIDTFEVEILSLERRAFEFIGAANVQRFWSKKKVGD